MKIYLLMYSCDTGSREDWNPFCMPFELFSSSEKRDARKEHILKSIPNTWEAFGCSFYEIDFELDNPDDTYLNQMIQDEQELDNGPVDPILVPIADISKIIAQGQKKYKN